LAEAEIVIEDTEVGVQVTKVSSPQEAVTVWKQISHIAYPFLIPFWEIRLQGTSEV